MARWRAALPGLLLAGLVACGGAPAATVSQPLDGATVAAGSTAVATSAATGPSRPPAPAATAAATATATAVPEETPTPAPTRAAGAALAPQPGGPVPGGWKIYRGPPAFPIVVAYPPDWTVDASLFPEQTVIFIVGPAGNINEEEIVEISAASQQTDANIDVLRDDFFYRKTAFCEKTGIEYTERRQLTGATFAILGAACDQSGELAFFQVASGLKGNDQWDIVMRTPYARRDRRLREVFDPILASLNVYALIER